MRNSPVVPSIAVMAISDSESTFPPIETSIVTSFLPIWTPSSSNVNTWKEPEGFPVLATDAKPSVRSPLLEDKDAAL